MKFTLIKTDITRHQTPCLIVGIVQDEPLSGLAAQLDQQSDGAIARLIERGDFVARQHKTLLVLEPTGLAAERLLLVGAGKREELNGSRYQELCHAAIKRLRQTKVERAINGLVDLDLNDHDETWRLRQAALISASSSYRYSATKTQIDCEGHLLEVSFSGSDATPLQQAQAIAQGVTRAREMGNLPANICTPVYMAEQAREIAQEHEQIEVEVLDQKALEELGMGALLGVAQGSAHPPQLIIMHYRGGGKQPPYALVGKGITFDTGGISIKASKNMDEMKYDMCGGAAVLGAIEACAQLQLPINVVAVVPAVENMPDGKAYRPGDVVTSLSGQTIEVLNTDAEGRLILCDALTYVQRFKPQVIIDAATLTGACVIALGRHASALMSADDDLAEDLVKAGEKIGDRAWRLPIWEDYQYALETPFADMANVGGPAAGAIVAACFLARFTKDCRWAHLDVAGTAWDGGGKSGASGRPVGLLVQYLIDRSQA